MPTRHTHKWDGLLTAYPRGTSLAALRNREYTHKHTAVNTNRSTNTHTGHSAARKSTVACGLTSRRGGASLIRGGRLAPTPSELHICRDLPHAEAMCSSTATERRCASSASHVDVDQRRSAHFVLVLLRIAAGLACSARPPCPASYRIYRTTCIRRVGRAAPPAALAARSSRRTRYRRAH